MKLSHFDEEGRARMVEVGSKEDTSRQAIARGRIYTGPEVINHILGKTVEKGDVLAVARVAGIMAAKKTSEAIPMCHPLMITGIDIAFTINEKETYIEAEVQVRTRGKTGVEMEALHACSVSLLTIYDMCKAIDKSMTITDIRLMEKSGGKSGHYRRGD